jgi:hypothetical protein
MSRLLSLACLALVLAAGSRALADVAPPPGYVETCTVAEREQPGTTCEACPAEDTNTAACPTKFSGTMYTYVCQTWGGSHWTEVWCDGTPAVPVTDRSCAFAAPATPTGAWSAVGGVGLLVAAAAVARRLRR